MIDDLASKDAVDDDWRLGPQDDAGVELQYRQELMGGESEWMTVGILYPLWAAAILEELKHGD